MVHKRHENKGVTDPSVLGEQLTFTNGKQAQNRFMKTAMGEYQSSWDVDPSKRGIPSECVVNMYEKWGHGQFGMILTGNVPVDPYNVEAIGNIIVCKENDSKQLRGILERMAKAMKTGGALAIMQITHAGRQTPIAVNPTPFSSSDVQLTTVPGFGKPVALTIEQIKTEVIDRFAYTAKVAYETGFDGVELHGAHGFLLSQFLSPTTNKRTDHYGGSVSNRTRIILEIFDAIRNKVPDDTGFLIGIKTNSVEFQDQGLQVEDAKTICRMIEKKGFDFVELSGGTFEKFAFHRERESTKKREAFFLEFAEEIRPVFHKTVVYVTGGFRTLNGMVTAVKNGSTQGIGLARPSAAEPDLPKKILTGKVTSAPLDKFDQNDFSLTVSAAVSQLAHMGKRSMTDSNNNVMVDIPDFSIPEEAEKYLEKKKEEQKKSAPENRS